MITTLFAGSGLTGMHVDQVRTLIWLTRDDGTVTSVDTAGAAVDHQRLADPLVDIAGSGGVLVIAAKGGGLLTIDPDDPGSPAVPFGTVGRTPSQVTVSARGRAALAAVRGSAVQVAIPGGGTTRYPLPTGTVGVAAIRSGVVAAVNEPRLGESRLRWVAPARRAARSAPLPELGRVGASTDGSEIYGAHPGANSVTAWEIRTGALTTIATGAVPGGVVEVAGLADGRIAVLTDRVLAILDSLADLVAPIPPSIAGPGELFVASWARLSYDLGTSGLTPTDISFAVPDGPEAGIVSYTREDGAAQPSPILVAGGRLGEYKVVMIDNSTGTEIAAASFTVTNTWEDAATGPSTMITGRTSAFAGDSGWGGGPNTPQNLGDLTHTGTWNVLVMMVDTSTARWPAAGLAQSRTDVLAHVTNGFPFGGVNRSARLYYEENSAQQLTLAVRNNAAFGPVAMPNAWTSYFAQTVDGAGTVVDARWAPNGASWQAFLTQAINDGVVTTADLRAVDSVVIVPFSPDATSAAGNRFAWPYGDIGKQSMLLGTNILTDRGDIACVQVPLNFAAQDGRQTHSTLSHELGHNLGLLDVYNIPDYPADVTGRITSNWEMMAGSRDTLPHYSASNKMRMGWVAAGQVRLFNFQGAGGVDQTVTLHAAELGAPPAGRFRTIEIRLGDGWNLYVEYRSEQAGFVSDDIPTDRRVVITDVTSENFTPPILRPRILFVPNDLDGDGRILDVGGDYRATDPGTGFDLSVAVVSTAADNAVVRVRYGSNARPELGIRPWDGGPTWQSPDIEVRNAKNAAQPALFNVPWAGHANTLVAKVRNNGDFAATGVRVDFYVVEYTAGDGPWQPLSSDTRNVPAGATVEFTTTWTPPATAGKHYCVIVRIALYQDPGNPAIVDANIYNNEARTNYTRFISASASPSTRTGASVLLSNPFGRATTVAARVQQTNELHRTFVDHTWLTVEPGAPRPITVLDEALYGTAEWPYRKDRDERWRKLLWGMPNLVSVTGLARNPQAEECAGLVPTGGACLSVQAGRSTVTRLERAWPGGVYGQVDFVDTSGPVPDAGVVLVEAAGAATTWTTTTRTTNGLFRTEIPKREDDAVRWVIAHYLGDFAAAPSESERWDL